MLISGLHVCTWVCASPPTQENVSIYDVSLDRINIGLSEVELTDSKCDEVPVGFKI